MILLLIAVSAAFVFYIIQKKQHEKTERVPQKAPMYMSLGEKILIS